MVRRPPLPDPTRPPVPGGTLVHRSVPRPTALDGPVDPALRSRVHRRRHPVPVGAGVTCDGPVPAGASSGRSGSSPEGSSPSRPTSTPLCRWPNSWFRPLRVGPACLRSSPNTSPGLPQGPGPPSGPEAGASIPSGGSVPSGSDSRRRVRRGSRMAAGVTSVNGKRAFPPSRPTFPQLEARRSTGSSTEAPESALPEAFGPPSRLRPDALVASVSPGG